MISNSLKTLATFVSTLDKYLISLFTDSHGVYMYV